MQKFFEGRAFGLLVVIALAAWTAQANDVSPAKGPEEDGTKPALVKIAGEGQMLSLIHI